jgi:phosphoribosylanthranilate isomerase
MKPLRLKVCGLKNPENYRKVMQLEPDLVGLIFYPPSPRYVESEGSQSALQEKPHGKTQKTGVFVNAEPDLVIWKAKEYHLEWVQLHGHESPDQLEILQKEGLKVIKAFPVDKDFNFRSVKDYLKVSDLFLFDTKTEAYGGSGQRFPWEILENYDEEVPFLLSGGLNHQEFQQFPPIQHPLLYGLDVNSKYEIKPGLKDLEKLKALKSEMYGIREPK